MPAPLHGARQTARWADLCSDVSARNTVPDVVIPANASRVCDWGRSGATTPLKGLTSAGLFPCCTAHTSPQTRPSPTFDRCTSSTRSFSLSLMRRVSTSNRVSSARTSPPGIWTCWHCPAACNCALGPRLSSRGPAAQPVLSDQYFPAASAQRCSWTRRRRRGGAQGRDHGHRGNRRPGHAGGWHRGAPSRRTAPRTRTCVIQPEIEPTDQGQTRDRHRVGQRHQQPADRGRRPGLHHPCTYNHDETVLFVLGGCGLLSNQGTPTEREPG